MTLKLRPIELFSVEGFVPPAEIADTPEAFEFYRAGRRPVFTSWSETYRNPEPHSFYESKAAGEGLYEFISDSDELTSDVLESAKAQIIESLGQISKGVELTFNLLRVIGVTDKFWIAAAQSRHTPDVDWI